MGFYGNKWVQESCLTEATKNINNMIIKYTKRLVSKYNSDKVIQKEIDKEYDKYIQKGWIKDKSESPKLIFKVEEINENEFQIILHEGSDVMINNILVPTFNKIVKEIKTKFKDYISMIYEDCGIISIFLKDDKKY